MTTISYVKRLPSLVTLVIELCSSLLTATMLAMVAEAHDANDLGQRRRLYEKPSWRSIA